MRSAHSPTPLSIGTPTRSVANQPVRQQYLELRAAVHRKLLNRLNLEALANAERSRAEGEIRSLLALLLSEESTPISLTERESLFAEVLDDVFGLGPLEPLLRDATINDILVNTYRNVFIERKGVLERVTATFQDDAHLMRVIDRIVSRVGRRVDDSSPMVDARLADGSRVNAIIPPLAVDGPLLSIRRFPAERLKADDLVALTALTQPMLHETPLASAMRSSRVSDKGSTCSARARAGPSPNACATAARIEPPWPTATMSRSGCSAERRSTARATRIITSAKLSPPGGRVVPGAIQNFL